MTIPLLSSQKHDSFVDKHGAALGAARSGLCVKMYFSINVMNRLNEAGKTAMKNSREGCKFEFASQNIYLRLESKIKW